MQYLCKKNIEMDKIIGLGNALVDVLATLKDDTLLDEMGLPKGSMQLIYGIKLQQINEKFANMKTHLATGKSERRILSSILFFCRFSRKNFP